MRCAWTLCGVPGRCAVCLDVVCRYMDVVRCTWTLCGVPGRCAVCLDVVCCYLDILLFGVTEYYVVYGCDLPG